MIEALFQKAIENNTNITNQELIEAINKQASLIAHQDMEILALDIGLLVALIFIIINFFNHIKLEKRIKKLKEELDKRIRAIVSSMPTEQRKIHSEMLYGSERS